MSDSMRLRVWPGHDGRGPVALGFSGALTPLDVDDAKKVSHDFVVAETGRRRAGPVHWVVLDYHAQGRPYLEQLGVDAQEGLHEFLRRSSVSVLVIAVAATDKRPPRAKRRRR